MAKEEHRTIRAEIAVPYTMAVGPVWTRFFEGLKEERIWGTKCKRCSRILVPARPFCSRCFEDMEEWVEVSQEGTIVTWCYVNYKYYGLTRKIPYITCAVRLDGSDCAMRHLIGGIDMSDIDKVTKRVRVGGRVKAVWRKEKRGDMEDIEYFKPVE